MADKIMAVKQVHLSDEIEPNNIHNELQILRDITKDDSRHFIHLFGVSTELYTVSTFINYIPGELTLRHIIYEDRFEVTYTQKIGYAIQLCQAVNYLHNNLKIVHNDINPRNILVDNDKLLLSNFSVSGYIGSKRHVGDGTLQYMAPEAVIPLTKTLRSTLDVWSTAATIIEIFTSAKPWPLVEDDDEFRYAFPKVLKRGYVIYPEGLEDIGSYSLVDILLPCFNAPNGRPAVKELIPKLEDSIVLYENEID
ncbi:putative mitogen-activated protein kinase kinase kinase 7-like [Glandiceps talaboti]